MTTPRRILIIGSGFGGLGLAIRLKRAGIESFTILEQGDDARRHVARQHVPRRRLRRAVDALLLLVRAEDRLDAEVVGPGRDPRLHGGLRARGTTSCATSASASRSRAHASTRRPAPGRVRTADRRGARRRRARERRRPAAPAADARRSPASRRFRGPTFHSARWNHDVDLAGKRVGVIGNAASAVQFIPEIAKTVGHLTIFQRSANWMIARGDRAFYGVGDVALEARARRCAAFYRALPLGLRRAAALSRSCAGSRRSRRLYTKWAMSNLENNVADPELRARAHARLPDRRQAHPHPDDFYPGAAPRRTWSS